MNKSPHWFNTHQRDLNKWSIMTYMLTSQPWSVLAGMHAERTGIRTHVDEAGVVSLPEVVQHAGLVEVRETSHGLDLLKLGRIHLLGVADVHLYFLRRRRRGREKRERERGEEINTAMTVLKENLRLHQRAPAHTYLPSGR